MRFFLLVAVGLAGVAHAHDADVVYVLAKQGPGRLVETVTLTGASLGLLVPIDADGDGLLTQADLDAKQKALRVGVWDEMPLSAGGRRCTVLEARAWLREGFVELEGTFDCGEGELRQDFRFLRVLPANYRVVLGSQLEGETAGRGFAQGSMTSVTVPRPPPPGAWDGSQFRLGLDAGLRRGGSALGLLAVLSLLLGVGSWRRGVPALGLLGVGLLVGGVVATDALPPLALLALAVIGSAAVKEPPVVLSVLGGLALGALGGGGPWPAVLGLGVGAVCIAAPAGLIAVAAGVMLRRRAPVDRWVRAAVALGAVAAVVVTR